jgi:hypothetical protein
MPADAPGSRPTRRNSGTIVVSAVVAAALVIGGLIWYFGFYDTAAGRCNRGDVGACLIYYAESQASASASAAAAQKCVVGPGDQSHNVRLVVSGSDTAASDCGILEAHGWANDYVPSADSQVCSFTLSNGTTVVVWDSGGQDYGQQDCHVLAQNQLPNWTGP